MITDSVEFLAAAVKELLPLGVPIHTEAVPQGFKRPCVFLSCDQTASPLLDGREKRTYTLTAVPFAPKGKNAVLDGAKLRGEVYAALRKVGGLQASNAKFGAKDGEQTLALEYSNHVRILTHWDKMGSLEHEEEIKEGNR